MGMGDKKRPLQTSHAPVRCSKCGVLFDGLLTARCPHPAVQRVYGEYICLYCCRKCKHGAVPKNIYGVYCQYPQEG